MNKPIITRMIKKMNRKFTQGILHFSPFLKVDTGKFCIALLALFLLTAPLFAQLTPRQINTELQRASALESQKDLPGAIAIYRRLHQHHPKRLDILLRFEAVLTRAGLHAEAASILQKRLAINPKDIGTRLRLGDSLFSLGQPDSAAGQWNRIIQNATTINPYALVADRYRKRNLDKQAAQTYHRARVTLKDPTLFARELAEIAERQTNYPEAAREYLTYVRKTPQYRGMIEGKLRDFAQNGDQHQQVFDILATNTIYEDQNRLNLLIAYALPAGFAAQTLDLLLQTTPIPFSAWNHLSRIARYTLDSNDPQTAIAAYRAMHDLVEERPDLKARAQLGLGRAYELAQRPTDAQTHYNIIITTYANRPETDEARFRLGVILRDHHKDTAGAQKAFHDLINTNRRNTWRYNALFELAEGYIQNNSADAAKFAWQQIITERNAADEGTKARFRLAEFRFLSGQIAPAQALLDTLLKTNVNRDIINDAIALSTLLQEGQRADSTMLKTYAQGRLKLRQNDPQAALIIFEALYETDPQSYLADRLLNHQAQIHTNNKHYPQAIQTYRKLINTLSWSPLCPAAQIAQANIYDTHLQQYYEAQKAYESLLIDYPLSLEADVARERLRTLQRKIQDLESKKEAG